MQKKRILSAVIAAALSATMTVPAFAAAPTFSDVPASHWAYTAIEKAAGAKMVGGIGNGKYSPTGTVTGGQLLAMLTRYFCPSDIETDAAVLEQAGCSGKWYSGNWYSGNWYSAATNVNGARRAKWLLGHQCLDYLVKRPLII